MGDHPKPAARILVTGFSVFPGAPENPTAWAIAELERERWQPSGAVLITRTFPVRYDIWSEIETTIARDKPHAVVGFGLSAKATGFTLESTARNQLGLGRPDAAGVLANAPHLASSGPATYPSRLPLSQINAALMAAGLPTSPSDDAGDYICNLYFYRLMTRMASHTGPHIGGFIHIPYLDNQLPSLERAGLPTAHLKTMTQRQLLQGVKVILGIVANTLATSSQRRVSDPHLTSP